MSRDRLTLLAQFALPLVALVIAFAYVIHGVAECRSVCSAYGEAWHAGEGAVLPPLASACTCIDGDGALRRRRP